MSAPELPATEKVVKCSVRDGRFVDPCWSLDNAVQNQMAAFSRAKGITRWHYTDMRTLEPSRTFFGIKSKEHPNGLRFNFCPWCGTDISEPFIDKEEERSNASA